MSDEIKNPVVNRRLLKQRSISGHEIWKLDLHDSRSVYHIYTGGKIHIYYTLQAAVLFGAS